MRATGMSGPLLRLVAVVLWLSTGLIAHAAGKDADTDSWQPLRRFIGSWTGSAEGEAGNGSVSRQYAFVLGNRFIRETNTSVYPPQEKNKRGETHEHWAMFSVDKQRKTLVLRQFHAEGFVNTYRRTMPADGGGLLVFDSEVFENFSNSWKARETYEFLSDDEFIETFELAPPGQPFQVYSRSRLKRTPG